MRLGLIKLLNPEAIKTHQQTNQIIPSKHDKNFGSISPLFTADNIGGKAVNKRTYEALNRSMRLLTHRYAIRLIKPLKSEMIKTQPANQSDNTK